jgi:hypothetical protein
MRMPAPRADAEAMCRKILQRWQSAPAKVLIARDVRFGSIFAQDRLQSTTRAHHGGAGGFLESTLVFDPGAAIAIADTDIVFDFRDGADPSAFAADGLFDIDTFFADSAGDPFSEAFDIPAIFVDDSFTIEGADEIVSSFDPQTGDFTVGAVPEPSSVLILLGGLGLLFPLIRRRNPH